MGNYCKRAFINSANGGNYFYEDKNYNFDQYKFLLISARDIYSVTDIYFFVDEG